jgi:hypothetical protein
MVVKVNTNGSSETALNQPTWYVPGTGTEHCRVKLNGREALYIKSHSVEYNKHYSKANW